jgi:hypothetical protein
VVVVVELVDDVVLVDVVAGLEVDGAAVSLGDRSQAGPASAAATARAARNLTPGGR